MISMFTIPINYTPWLVGCLVGLVLLVANIIAIAGKDILKSNASFYDVFSAVVLTLFLSLFSWFIVVMLLSCDLLHIGSLIYRKYNKNK